MTEAQCYHHLSRIGILTDNSTLYDRSVQDNLELFCRLYQVPASRVPEALEQVNLADDRQTVVQNLSKGMKQRVTLARALLHRPEILFLDEPASALDPGNARRIHESLKELNRAGTTIFLSTHDMEEAETLCDRIAFLHQGRIGAMDTPQLLRRRYGDATITVTTTDRSYQVACDEEGARRVSEAITSGKLVSIHSNEPSLSDIFIKVTGGSRIMTYAWKRISAIVEKEWKDCLRSPVLLSMAAADHLRLPLPQPRGSGDQRAGAAHQYGLDDYGVLRDRNDGRRGERTTYIAGADALAGQTVRGADWQRRHRCRDDGGSHYFDPVHRGYARPVPVCRLASAGRLRVIRPSGRSIAISRA
ncbi:hypothetical protein J6TS7_10390 [Paenibacillus dendritiformis]|nr:hypothetical protein J6TS7_10390 [Paenibacillus dendritiformis]